MGWTRDITSVPIATKTTTYAILSSDYLLLCDSSGGAFTITLPDPANLGGKEYVIKKIDSSANAVTIATNGAETIDGLSSVGLADQYELLRVITDGSNWHIL